MDDESEPPENQYPLAQATSRMSKTPSWILLGFLLGALFVYAWMRHDKAAPAKVTVQMLPPAPSTKAKEPTRLSTIEAVFAVWGEYAKWSDDITEVALWNSQDKAFTEFYEVRRWSGTYYFRSIPALTRRTIRHGKFLPDSPLQFTETEEQYREWLEYDRRERVPETPLYPPQTPIITPRPPIVDPRPPPP